MICVTMAPYVIASSSLLTFSIWLYSSSPVRMCAATEEDRAEDAAAAAADEGGTAEAADEGGMAEGGALAAAAPGVTKAEEDNGAGTDPPEEGRLENGAADWKDCRAAGDGPLAIAWLLLPAASGCEPAPGPAAAPLPGADIAHYAAQAEPVEEEKVTRTSGFG